MKILIDADGCPVVDITLEVAKRNLLECIIMCDTSHQIEREGILTIIVSKGTDSVDYALLKRVCKGDIIVTQDYGLAAYCLTKHAYPINQSGMFFTNENIDQLLLQRHDAKKVRNAGGRLRGPAKRRLEDDENYESQLEKLINQNQNSN